MLKIENKNEIIEAIILDKVLSACKHSNTVWNLSLLFYLSVFFSETGNWIVFTEKADSCSLHAVTFLKQFEIATVNSIGQLKVWDLRQSADEPVRIFHL